MTEIEIFPNVNSGMLRSMICVIYTFCVIAVFVLQTSLSIDRCVSSIPPNIVVTHSVTQQKLV